MYVSVYIHVYIYIYTYMCVYNCIYTYTYTYVYTYMIIYVYVYRYTFIYIYIYILYDQEYIYICIFIERQTYFQSKQQYQQYVGISHDFTHQKLKWNFSKQAWGIYLGSAPICAYWAHGNTHWMTMDPQLSTQESMPCNSCTHLLASSLLS